MLLLFLMLLTGLLVLVTGFLLGCWLIARSRGYAQLGRGVALFSAKRASHLSQLFARGAAYCKSRSVALLVPWHLREQQEEGKESRFAGVAIWRLSTLVVSLIVVLGELPIWVLRSPALYTFLRQTPLLPFDLLSVFVGLLWLSVPGVFGLWFAEAVKFVPPWAGLFPYRHWLVRIVCAAIALSFLVFSHYENYWLTAYTQCLLVPGCQINAQVPVNIAAGFNVALTLAGVLSLFGVIYGLAALAGLFFAVCALVCSCFKHMFEFTSLSATDFQVTVLPGLNPYSVYLPRRQEPFLLADEAGEDISNGKGNINVLE